jgi:hypothetical protein
MKWEFNGIHFSGHLQRVLIIIMAFRGKEIKKLYGLQRKQVKW